ncbi:DUF6489 family protein [Flavisphingomonas formosensis]|uniref:DUF6489 family protein n=1 Tax=Flavisphingomonas formosensis TaxID=861534 RepID=UPI0012FAAAF6|nr:DUF6489 family protein [Sphingomonas formosensis]
MKISVDVDCTPEEARRFLGLPDLTSVHEIYLDKIRRTIDDGMITPDTLQTLLNSWTPMGEAGFALWKQLFDKLGGK